MKSASHGRSESQEICNAKSTRLQPKRRPDFEGALQHDWPNWLFAVVAGSDARFDQQQGAVSENR
jgi:hypothetical protein